MQQNELATMPISDCIVMVRSHNPFYAKKYPAFDHPNFRFTGLSDDNNRADIRQIRSVTVAEFEAEEKMKRAEAFRQAKGMRFEELVKALCNMWFTPQIRVYEDADGIYTSTKEIFKEAMRLLRVRLPKYDIIEITEGEILKISADGIISRDKYTVHDDFFGYHWGGYYGWGWSGSASTSRSPSVEEHHNT